MGRRDIDVDEEELDRFIRTLSTFQNLTKEKFQAVSTAWQKVDETWQGDSKQQFTGQFEATQKSVEITLESGENGLEWLEDFHRIVREFEGNY